MTHADTHSSNPPIPPEQRRPHDMEHAAHGQHPHISMRTYVLVFIALMVLLFVTVGAAFINFGHHAINVTVALVIAFIKAALVVLYFMHVRHASRLTQIFVVGAFLWLGIMFVYTFADYLTRDWLPVSAGWDGNPVKQTMSTGAATPGSPDVHPGSEPPHQRSDDHAHPAPAAASGTPPQQSGGVEQTENPAGKQPSP